jgi:DNA-binding transcriptional ArsR family regulator
MVKDQRTVSAVFAALADPTRRRILARLSDRREDAVTALAKPFRISLPAISRHLRVLEKARLIERRRTGRVHLIRSRPAGLAPARDWIEQYAAGWDYSFDALEEAVAKEQRKDINP